MISFITFFIFSTSLIAMTLLFLHESIQRVLWGNYYEIFHIILSCFALLIGFTIFFGSFIHFKRELSLKNTKQSKNKKSLLFSNKIISFLFIFQFICISLISLMEYMTKFIYSFFKNDDIEMIDTFLYISFLIFIAFSIYSINYSILCEIIQRKNKLANRHFIVDVLIDYIFTIPFCLIYAFLGAIYILFRNNRFGSFFGESINDLKHITYIGLVFIAIEDYNYISAIKKSNKFYSTHFDTINKIDDNLDLFIFSLFFLITTVFLYNLHFNFINISLSIHIFCTVLYITIIYDISSKQLETLNIYLKNKGLSI
jgi:hypothetical protein